MLKCAVNISSQTIRRRDCWDFILRLRSRPRNRHIHRPRLLFWSTYGQRQVTSDDDFHRRSRGRPSLGEAGILMVGWNGVFMSPMLYGIIALIWSATCMPETLPVSERKSLAVGDVLGAFGETFSDRQTLGYALAAGGVQGCLFALVFSSQ
jgi:hypothetical protein